MPVTALNSAAEYDAALAASKTSNSTVRPSFSYYLQCLSLRFLISDCH